MIDHFKGKDGLRRLETCLLRQPIVGHDPAVARALAKRAHIRSVSPGEFLTRQGDVECDLLFLLTGRAAVIVNNRELGIFAAEGEHIGEVAMIEACPRTASVRATEPTVIACVSDADFAAVADKHPQLWRNVALHLVRRLRGRDKLLAAPRTVPSVFIGSASETIKVAEALRDALQTPELKVVTWVDNSLARASDTIIESILAAVQASDFAVMVIGADDYVVSRDVGQLAPRDNVLFEIGLFMGALGRERTFVLSPNAKNVKTPSDLLGVLVRKYDSPRSASFAASIARLAGELKVSFARLGAK